MGRRSEKTGRGDRTAGPVVEERFLGLLGTGVSNTTFQVV